MSLTLRLKTKQGQQIVHLSSTDNVEKLKAKISEIADIPYNRLNVLGGFPPKKLDISDPNKSISTVGIANGDTLIVNEMNPDELPPPPPPAANMEQASSLLTQRLADEEMEVTVDGILLKQVVPSDNSCLFTSIGYVLNGKIDTDCNGMMRQIIAQHVENDKESYNEAILGKPNEDYCAWIQKPETWGGAIEVSILSSFYGLEIAVVDITNGIINRFGEDRNFGMRVFLLFDGIHYDPLYLESLNGGPTKTIFSIEDETVMQQAQQLAMEAKSSRQFTDVNHFSLKCIQCNCYLVGQVEAQQHAKTTGHTNFGEV